MKYILAFDEEKHQYWVNGGRVPSVTQIIDEYFPFEGGGLAADRAADFGKAVHKMIELRIKGTLDIATVDPALLPYLEQFEIFFCDVRKKERHLFLITEEGKKYFQTIESETMLFSKKYFYAGTMDMVLDDVVYDIKTGHEHPKHKMQVAAYKQLYNENNKQHKVTRCRAVYLNGTGDLPKVVEGKPEDFGAFLSCLNLHNWRIKENLNGNRN